MISRSNGTRGTSVTFADIFVDSMGGIVVKYAPHFQLLWGKYEEEWHFQRGYERSLVNMKTIWWQEGREAEGIE